MARTFRLTLEYDGAEFEGWQIQTGGRRTVQGELEIALTRVTRERVRAVGSGRTDAGVHAEGQVASVRLETGLEPERLRCALNAALPDDVAVRELAVTHDEFDARRDATGKLYRYSLWNAPDRAPLRRRRSLCLAAPARSHADPRRRGAAGRQPRLRVVPGGRLAGEIERAHALPARRHGRVGLRRRPLVRGQRLPAPHGAQSLRDPDRGGIRAPRSRGDDGAARGARSATRRPDGAAARAHSGVRELPRCARVDARLRLRYRLGPDGRRARRSRPRGDDSMGAQAASRHPECSPRGRGSGAGTSSTRRTSPSAASRARSPPSSAASTSRTFTPHVDTGDFVIVVNAEKVKLTGNKLDQKFYNRHSGYPGRLQGRSYRRPARGPQADRADREGREGHAPEERPRPRDVPQAQGLREPDHPHAARSKPRGAATLPEAQHRIVTPPASARPPSRASGLRPAPARSPSTTAPPTSTSSARPRSWS